MRESLSLQRSLFRAQQLQISKSVAGASRAFRAYEARYRRATRSFRRPLSFSAVEERVQAADVVFVGDYHTLKQAQQGFLDLAHAALASGRRVVLALELLEGRHQGLLDAFLAGRLSEAALQARTGHQPRGPFDLWANFSPILHLAKSRRLETLALDHRPRAGSSLELRDRFAAKAIARAASAPDRPLVLVLMGQYHVAPAHLPARVREALGRTRRQQLVVYQNAEGVYWQLASRGLAARCDAVELAPDAVCLVSASPVVCQRSFLDYVEAESGDAPVDEAGVADTFSRVARAIARLAGVDVRAVLPDVEIATASHLSVLDRLSKRGRFTARELDHLRRHVLSRESAWIPRARVAWLASLSLNHVAEEAAHFVRNVAVGPAMEAERSRAQAFWARCLEEALGFFGSKLVNPARRCTGLDEWARHFRKGDEKQRRVAAFVLALAALPDEQQGAVRALLPLGNLSLFMGVSHALGYLLGDALFRLYERGALPPREVRALFADPFDDAEAAFHALSARARTAPPHGRRSAPARIAA